MEQWMRSVDVISLCEADGRLLPLRIRMEDGGQSLRVDIQRVLSTKDVSKPGREGKVFDCFGKIGNLNCRLELKYCARSQMWLLLKKDF